MTKLPARNLATTEVRITNTGAIVLCSSVAVDGYSDTQAVRVVTHIHSDHVVGLERSIKRGKTIAATPITHDLLGVLGYNIPRSRKLSLPYDISYELSCGKMYLRRTNHIPGSCMVVVEYEDGGLVGYTSDFKMPGTYIVEEPDILVVDATYGKEEWKRPWQEEVNDLLVDAVLDGLSRGPVYVYGYNGKIQEVMVLLRSRGVDAPYIAPLRAYLMARILEKHGYNIGNVYSEDDPKVLEILKSGWFIAFMYYHDWRKRNYTNTLWRPTNILLTGWEFREPIKKLSEREWIISFSDHADFTQLVTYIEESKPKYVIVDSYRAGTRTAEYFARYISRKIGIPATPMP